MENGRAVRHCLLALFGLLLVHSVHSRSTGPPLNVQNFNLICSDMVPQHGGTPQPGNGNYVINTNLTRISNTSYSYTAGQTYAGRSRVNNKFVAGFINFNSAAAI